MTSVKPHGQEVAEVEVMVGSVETATIRKAKQNVENRKKLLIDVLCVSSASIMLSRCE